MLKQTRKSTYFMVGVFIVLLLGSFTVMDVIAQGNNFNFQGRLNDGTNPADGRYDLTFRLFDAIAGGNPLGPPVPKPNTVLINGVFSINIDMGPGFSNPNNTFIEIAIKPAGSPNAFTVLGPRQQLTVVPFAVRAANATNADNATTAVNAQNAANAINAVDALTANNALALGGFNASEYPRLSVVNTGDLRTNGALAITGNAFQPINANGFVKAMLEVDLNSAIVRCYNAITNTSTGNCGFQISQPLGNLAGVYRVNFGFPIADRFVVVTPKYLQTTTGTNNGGANYRPFDSTSIEVFTFVAGDSSDTSSRQFTLILF